MAKGDDGGARVEETVRRVLAEGGEREKLTDLLSDNFKLREKLREAKGRIESLEKAGPEEGGAVLTKAEAEALATYRALGKPEEVKKGLEEGARARAALDARDEATKFERAAKAHGLNAALLTRLAGQDGLRVVEFRKEKGEGDEELEVAWVAKAGEKDAKPERLTDYATREWAEIGDAITTAEGTAEEQEPAGAPWPRQPGELKPPTGKDPTLEERAASKVEGGAYAGF